MTQTAPRQTASAKLREALAALKRAENEGRIPVAGTPESARAIALEEGLRREVYELATTIDHDAPEEDGRPTPDLTSPGDGNP
ncbi:MAG TPA: hypothetical protein VEP94_01645 [Solirubrobacterales bacterium]|nr:hypothetical protein [Solirubrobacterales bacterium]